MAAAGAWLDGPLAPVALVAWGAAKACLDAGLLAKVRQAAVQAAARGAVQGGEPWVDEFGEDDEPRNDDEPW
eukprot:12915008-Prorocentrum_lima.AAC.1